MTERLDNGRRSLIPFVLNRLSGVPGAFGVLLFYPAFGIQIPKHPKWYVLTFAACVALTLATTIFEFNEGAGRKKIRVGLIVDFLWLLALVVSGRLSVLPLMLYFCFFDGAIR